MEHIARREEAHGHPGLDILRTGDPSHFVFNFVDTRVALPNGNYGTVLVELEIGDDSGEAEEALRQRRTGHWAQV